MTKYKLIDSDTQTVVAEFGDFDFDYNVAAREMMIRPITTSGVKYNGKSSKETPEDGLGDLADRYHHEDTIDMLREIFLRVDRLLKLYGYDTGKEF